MPNDQKSQRKKNYILQPRKMHCQHIRAHASRERIGSQCGMLCVQSFCAFITPLRGNAVKTTSRYGWIAENVFPSRFISINFLSLSYHRPSNIIIRLLISACITLWGLGLYALIGLLNLLMRHHCCLLGRKPRHVLSCFALASSAQSLAFNFCTNALKSTLLTSLSPQLYAWFELELAGRQ